MLWTGQVSQKYILLHLSNAIVPPEPACAVQRQFRDREWRIIADIAQGEGNVSFMFHGHDILMLDMRIAYLQ